MTPKREFLSCTEVCFLIMHNGVEVPIDGNGDIGRLVRDTTILTIIDFGRNISQLSLSDKEQNEKTDLGISKLQCKLH